MNEKILIRKCPICSSNLGRILHTQKFKLSDGHPLPESYDCVVCNECGFCFADTHLTQEGYDAYYAGMSKYADSSTSTGAGVLPWDISRLVQTADQVAMYCPDKDKRILDIGCANGGLLMALQKMGYNNLCGIDPAESCVSETRKITNVEGWVGTLSEIPEGIGSFDGIILSHVMEHVRDLISTMNSVRHLLRPGGWVYIEVPDASRYKEFLVAPFQDFNTEHINHFSQTSLANLLGQSCFTPKLSGTKNIYSSKNMPYPALFWFADKKQTEERYEIVEDKNLSVLLQEYIYASSELVLRISTNITSAIKNYSELIVWGTGQLTTKLLLETSLRSANIVYFVDGNPINQGKILQGRKVVSGSEIVDQSVPILVCSLINADSIIEAIRALNLKNPIIKLLGDENKL